MLMQSADYLLVRQGTFLRLDALSQTAPSGDKLERVLKSTEDERSLAEPLKMQRPLDNGSEPVITNQLIGLLEAALASRGLLSPSRIGYASLEQGSDNTTHSQYLPPCDLNY